MKNNRRVFFLIEIVLAVVVGVMLFRMFGSGEEPRKVTVIVSNSDSGQWQAFIEGVKQAARDVNLNIVIAGTGQIADAQEEQNAVEQAIAEGSDALIVQPAPGGAAVEEVLQQAKSQVPLILAERAAVWENEETGTAAFACVKADPYACGGAVAQLLLDDYGGNLEGKKIGLVNHTLNTEDAVRREQGFLDGLENTGATISWQLHGMENESSPEERIEAKKRVDIIAALDTLCLEAAGKAGADHSIHGAVVYGIGTSMQVIYDLDHDNIRGFVYINGFNTGYQCVQEIARKLEHPRYRMQDHEITWKIIRRDDLFLEENEDLLFMVE